ncbi:response regulator transcription factor [Duganella sp. P38]|uniref:response regulator transcription factor n=1 Tax=Duganella sp. P38 TaxID=3423949 RepID=UPI003D799CD2
MTASCTSCRTSPSGWPTCRYRGDLSPQSQLDERALEIFTLMAEGLTNAEIAEKLDVSTKTISNISQAVKEKLGVHRPAYITRLAVKHGLIEP